MTLRRAAWASVLAVALAVGCGPKTQGGEITLSETSWDFGDVPIGVRVEHAFTISNTGTGPLELEPDVEVETLEGCWPPSLVVGPTTLQPGESATLIIPFKMSPGMGGPHHFRFVINSNAGSEPAKPIDIRANAR